MPPDLFSALHGMPAQAPQGGGSDWFLDTGASTHMASLLLFLNKLPSATAVSCPFHTLAGYPCLPPLPLCIFNNVLISPNLIKNLISVRALTRGNSVSVEFDPCDFSIKDLGTKTVLLRCDSFGISPCCGPRNDPLARHLLFSLPTNTSLWHARLGHPGDASLQRILHSFDFTCAKDDDHTCHACRLGKHVRMPFYTSN